MSEQKPIEIDLDMFLTSMQLNEPDAISFLDLQTGEIKLYWEGTLDGEAVGKDFKIEEFLNDDRYRVIKEVGSHVSFEVMRDFIKTLPEEDPKYKLEEAISGRKPFRTFKDTLLQLGTLRDRWFKFEEQANENLALEWLNEEEISAVFVRRVEFSSVEMRNLYSNG